MTKIEFALSRFFPGKTELLNGGVLRFRPTRRVSLNDELVMPDPFDVRYYNNAFTVDVQSTSAGWAWEISVIGKFSAYYSIPETTNTLQFNTLTPLDPDTLETGEPEPAWVTKLDALIDLGGVPGKDGKDGTKIYTGDGVPTTPAKPGDLYIDTTTGTLYNFS